MWCNVWGHSNGEMVPRHFKAGRKAAALAPV